MTFSATDFIRESNAIEEIHREPTEQELAEFQRFMTLDRITVRDLLMFVAVYEPGAELRSQPGMNVRIGSHRPPRGGTRVREELGAILRHANRLAKPFYVHLRYEALHPFTDCNGRSGRMLWAWQHKDISLGFLRTWYYQSHDENQQKE